MALFLVTLYFLLILLCFIYLAELIKNSQIDWQIIELNDNEAPFVSIIIPTLHEESNIERCLISLKNLDYPKYEIIVVDGGSSDRTVEIARNYADKVIVDPSLPEGWIGKSYGCHLGYEAARGDILLFTDADTVHHPTSLRTFVGQLLGSDAALLSLLPYQISKKWHEYLTSFYFFFSFLAGGPLSEISNPYKQDAFMAIGQYLLFTREGYEKIGGHLAVSSSIVEDIALAKLVKENKLKLLFLPSTRLVTCRMYPESFRDFYQGFKKSIYGGLTVVPLWRIFFIVLWILYAYIAPYLLITALLNSSISIFEVLVNLLLYLLFVMTITWYWRHKGDVNIIMMLFYPIFLTIDIVIILIAGYKLLRGSPVKWRGRTYATSVNNSAVNNDVKLENS